MKAHQRAEFVYGDNFFTCFTLFFSFKRVYRAGVPPVIWHGQALAMLIIDKKYTILMSSELVGMGKELIDKSADVSSG